MSGCPYSKWSWVKDCEICKATPEDKPTHGAVKCDFGFENCAEFKAKSERKTNAERLDG